MIRLKVERTRRGWSQTKLGALARLAASEISRMENGFLLPYPRQARRLARVLGIPADKLLDHLGDDATCTDKVEREAAMSAPAAPQEGAERALRRELLHRQRNHADARR